MNNQGWSWLLGIVGVVGFILAGKKVWWAWYINLGCQALWLVYAYVTTQYGFVATAVVYTFVFYKNARDWTREHFRKDQANVAAEFNQKMRFNKRLESAEAMIARGEPISPATGEKRVMTQNQSSESLGLSEAGAPIKDILPIFFTNEEMQEESFEDVLNSVMSDIREDAFTLGTGYNVWFEETINGKYLHWEFV